MPSVIYILGKHKSIEEFPTGYFSNKICIGLNHQAVRYQTSLGITGHDHVIEYYKEQDYDTTRWIVTRPTFEGSTHSSDWYINQLVPAHVMELIDATDEQIDYAVEKAIEGNKEFQYPNYWTTLHLALFFAMIQGFKEINIVGCNNESGTTKGYPEMINIDYAKRHTQKIIDSASKYGVQINWVKGFMQDTQGV